MTSLRDPQLTVLLCKTIMDDSKSNEVTELVFDLGGGTFDTSVVEFRPEPALITLLQEKVPHLMALATAASTGDEPCLLDILTEAGATLDLRYI